MFYFKSYVTFDLCYLHKSKKYIKERWNSLLIRSSHNSAQNMSRDITINTKKYVHTMKMSKNDSFWQILSRRITTQRISVARMTYFASECFLSNIHLKWMTFGLFVKPHVSNKKLIITKLTFFDFSHQRCSVEKYIPKNFANFTGKHLCRSLSPAILLKRDSNMDFSSEICEIFKNTYFEEHQRRTDCFSNLKHGIQVFHNIFFFHSKFWSFRQNPDNESSSECILVEILCVLFTLMSSFASYWKKVQTTILRMLRNLILQSRDLHLLNGDPP